MTKAGDVAGTLVEVAVGLPVAGTFHYTVPPQLRPALGIGVRVQVPFGNRSVTGFVVGLPTKSPAVSLRDIDDIPDPEPVFSARQLPFFRFISTYYFAPLGEVLRTALPAGLFRGTRPVLAIAPKGVKALGTTLLDETDRLILEALAGGEELTVDALAKRTGRDVQREVQRLERWEFLSRRQRLSALTATRKYETRWRLPPGLSLAEAQGRLTRRAPKREAALAALAEAGTWVGAGELKQTMANPRPTLNELVAAGLVEAAEQEVYRAFDGQLIEPVRGKVTLTDEQQTAVDAVGEALDAARYQPFCLHGVTGSGKTEVYIRLTKRALAAGRSAIVLVPEIALTPQLLGRFIAQLGDVVAPYHSGLSTGERYDQWRRMRRGEAKVVVGARSALFAPLDSLGLVVVDEEHESSFKQDDGVTYHARDLALKLASENGCPVVLGSATPSLETYAAARDGRYTLLELTKRPTAAPLPVVQVVDMREQMRRRPKTAPADQPAVDETATRLQTSARRVLSEPLVAGLRETLDAGEQAILFLNRRGYSTYAFCLECGVPLTCPLCDISLTYHERERQLRCHYCQHAAKPPKTCPQCASVNLFFGGMGTERLEEEVGKLFPQARLARLDRDAVRGKGDLVRVLQTFSRGDADVLIGTQMVAKGHDFPRVTLVGVVDADAALLLPDFRAAERTFSLVTQVAGRAGRADRPGRVFLQTFQPEHYAIETASRHDYRTFFEEEIKRRAQREYPPEARLAVVRITTATLETGNEACRAAKQAAQSATRRSDVPGGQWLGPAPSVLHRVQGKYRWNLLVKARRAAGLHQFCHRLITDLEGRGFRPGTFRLDIDPSVVL